MKNVTTIRYISGREEKFDIELLETTAKLTQARLKEFASSPTIVLQTDTELIIIPTTAVECISIVVVGTPTSSVTDKMDQALAHVRRAKRVK